jgi:alkaline phosphatase D
MSADRRLTRRAVLATGAAGAAFVAGAGRPAAVRAGGLPAADLFSLGVASGYPRADRVVLWTRLAPDPLTPGGGMPARAVPVSWELAEDERFRRGLRRGVAQADPSLAHSVHVDVAGLLPGRDYFYRFRAGGRQSVVGRTRTTAAAGARVAQSVVGVVSCQRYEHGFFSAYRHLVGQDPDLIVHLGDYIYENPIPPGAGPRAPEVPEALRPVADTLEGYRLRHALYKTDRDLQAAHAAAPWAAILDNHDAVEDGDGQGRDAYVRRAAAYQAFYEHMPLPPGSYKGGATMQIYRGVSLGALADLHLLDTRQFRDSQEVCAAPPPNIGPACERLDAEDRTMLGPRQERWLLERLGRSQARWNLVVQTMLMAHFDFDPGPGTAVYQSAWDGYGAQRRRLIDAFGRARGANPVVIGGDWHTSWVNELKLDQRDPASPTVAPELLAQAVSSDPAFTDARSAPAVAANPIVRYYGAGNGYLRLRLREDELRAAFIDVDADSPLAGARASAGWVVERGSPVPQRG